jgi:hypothetical protein
MDTINEAEKLFYQHLKEGKKIVADLKSNVYRAVLSKGNEETLETMIKVRKQEIDFVVTFLYQCII